MSVYKLEAMKNPDSDDGRHLGHACMKHDLTGCGCGRCLYESEQSRDRLQKEIDQTKKFAAWTHDEATEYMDDVRRRLARAVEALKWVAEHSNDHHVVTKAQDALREIEGGRGA